jgi:very-short-patch-repair endonuclease
VPDGEPVDPVGFLQSRLGASWWSAMVAGGVTDGDLRGAVRRGRVVALGSGTYALPGTDDDLVVAARLRGRLTCCSAAGRHGLDLLTPPAVPHVAVPRSRPDRSENAVVHRRDTAGTGPLVPVLATLLAVLRCLPPADAVVVIASAVRLGQARVASLRSRLRGPGSVEARRVLGLADGRSGSVIETLLRLGLRGAGLPLDLQVLVPGIGRVDFLVGGWLVLEVDGFTFHSERAQYRADRARANGLAARGYVLLRFTYEDIMFRLPETVAQVVAVYARGR